LEVSRRLAGSTFPGKERNMLSVKDILRTKGDDTWFVTPQTSVLDALKFMADKQIGALIVMDNENLAGIISERDFARMVAESGKFSPELTVDHYMTPKVFTVSPDQSIEACMELMTDKRIRHLPVLEAGKLVGVISIGDVVKALIETRDILIRNLENYIEGRGYVS
jgi:CBS domain-containing protein